MTSTLPQFYGSSGCGPLSTIARPRTIGASPSTDKYSYVAVGIVGHLKLLFLNVVKKGRASDAQSVSIIIYYR